MAATQPFARRHVTGALCAGAAVLAMTACAMDLPPQFTVAGTGTLSGLLYLDRDRSGTFDPSSGDSALGHVHLLVHPRGSSEVIAGGDTYTDAAGRFSVASLPAGTHSLQIDTTGLGSGIAFCNNPLPVSVYLDEIRFVPVDARGGCVISIRDAELQALGARVTVRGTVTSTLAQISTGTVYVEDGTGGLQVFSPTGATVAIGDVVEVAGTLTTFSNEFELSPSTINSVTPGTPLVPFSITTQQAAAAAGDSRANLQGRLVRITGAKLLDAFTTGAGRNAQIDDGSGALTVRFDSHVTSDTVAIKTAFTAGKCYTWTGILKAFTSPGVELFPRTLSEAVEVPCP